MNTLAPNLHVRPLTPGDIPALTRLFIAYEVATLGTSEQTEETVRANWLIPTFHLETDSWGVFADDTTLVAAAAVEQEAHVHYFPFACIHPDYTNQGIGTYLLHEMEQWIREHIPLAPEHSRIISAIGTSSKNTAAQHLFVHEGYHEVRRFWRMSIEMNTPPAQPLWDAGITVRTYRVGEDEHTTFEMVEEAFQDHWGHLPSTFEQWESDYLNRSNFDANLWYLACDGSRIIGGALCRYRQQVGWVGKLAVLRPWRHRGVGKALLLHAFNEFYQRGTYTVELVVDAQSLTGAVRLYEYVGMHVASENIAYQKEIRAGVELSTQTL